MRRKRFAEDLSVEELRLLLIEKQRARRQKRLEHFRRSGRLIVVEDHPIETPLDHLSSRELNAADDPAVISPPRTWLDRMLLGIEVLAVLGLAFVLLNGFTLIRDLNREVVAM
ncbi:MAG: hypothetical protein N3A60_12885, partial [Thermanaerothrix sp.]|nr:hypothetical protein [Thermanaerothrix sp.]